MFKTVAVGVAAAGLAFLAGSARGPSEKQVCLDSVEPIIEVIADMAGETVEYGEIERACEMGMDEWMREARSATTFGT